MAHGKPQRALLDPTANGEQFFKLARTCFRDAKAPLLKAFDEPVGREQAECLTQGRRAGLVSRLQVFDLQFGARREHALDDVVTKTTVKSAGA